MLPVAAIDAGSNAIRLAIAFIGPTGILVRRINRRYALRLGADVFKDGRIPPAGVRELEVIFDDIAARMQGLGVTRYRAVATSAMREAANGSEIAAALERRTGIELEIITGAEEGRIMRLTLMRALGTLSSDCVLVDLGGGSVEIERTTGVDGCSLPLGTVRLLERHPALRGRLARGALDEIYASVRTDLHAGLARPAPAPLAIGTGGNLDALARLVPVAPSKIPAIDVRKLHRFAVELARIDTAERARRYELRPDRADVILPAALVILALVEVFGLERFVVPGTGIRESILHTLTAEMVRPSRARELLQVQSHDLSLPDRRARLARRLFELLTALHGLWPPALAPLEAAAYLLDGSVVQSPRRAAEEAIELLRASPELDLDERGRVVAAHTARAALGVGVDAGRLRPADRPVAAVLGALLRLTRAILERSESWEPTADLMRDPLVIHAGLRGRITRSEVMPLERVLGRRIRVR